MRMRCLAVLAILVFDLLISGCRSMEMEELSMDYKAVEQFQKLMDEDQAGDKKSVEWDGTEACVIEDPMDDNNILDGRGGFQPFKDIVKDEWRVKTDVLAEESVVCDTGQHFRAEGEDWYLEILQADFAKADQELKQDSMMKDVTETELSQNIKKGNLKANLYRGLRTVKEGELAGYVLIAEDYFSHTYQLSYFGTGNMGVVKDKAMRLFGSFETEAE